MRYTVSFFDGLHTHIEQKAVPDFMRAMNIGSPIFYQGSTYSGKSISSIKTIFSFLDQKEEEAEMKGKQFCRYGILHQKFGECTCRDSRSPLLSQEEIELRKIVSNNPEKMKELYAPLMTK